MGRRGGESTDGSGAANPRKQPSIQFTDPAGLIEASAFGPGGRQAGLATRRLICPAFVRSSFVTAYSVGPRGHTTLLPGIGRGLK